MPAEAGRLSEEDWAVFLENWGIGLSSSTPKERLRSQWKSLLQQYTRRFNSVVQTTSDFDLKSSNVPQLFAPWAMKSIDHDLLELLLTAEFSDHHVQETQPKQKHGIEKSKFKCWRRRIRSCLGLSVWKIYMYFGRNSMASRDCLMTLDILCSSRISQDDSLRRRQQYLDEVLYPNILSVSVSRRGPICTADIACAETTELHFSFHFRDFSYMKCPEVPSVKSQFDDDTASSYEPSETLSEFGSDNQEGQPHPVEPKVVETRQTRQASRSRPATAPLRINRIEKRSAQAAAPPDPSCNSDGVQLNDDGPQRKRPKMDIAQILAPTTMLPTNGPGCDWFLPDRPLSASPIHIFLCFLVAAQLDDFLVLQPPAEAGFRWNSQDLPPPGAVWIEAFQERFKGLSMEQSTYSPSFTLLFPLRCDDSWVLVSVLFKLGAQGSVEFFDPLYDGNDSDILEYDDTTYKPLELVRHVLAQLLPSEVDKNSPMWTWKTSLRRCPGQSKDDSGVSVCLAAMHLVSGTSLPEESDLLLARRLLLILFACAAPQLAPSPQATPNITRVLNLGNIAATAKVLHDIHVKSFRDKLNDISRPHEAPTSAVSSPQPGGMIRLLESNRLSSLAAVETFKRRHEMLSKANVVSTEALEQSSHLSGVVLFLLDQVRKSQARNSIKLKDIGNTRDARNFRLQLRAMEMALDAFVQEGSGTGELPSDAAGDGVQQQQPQAIGTEGAEKSPEEKGLSLRLDALIMLEHALDLMVTDLNGWQKEINTIVAEI